MDDVFRALADPTRRSLLDELFKQDGQTLSALEQRLPMTRFGVMKHLRVLEEAGLVVTQAARAREAALPERRPDPARPRPLGEQVRRALGRRAERPQARHRGARRWRRCSRSTSRRRPSVCGRRSPTPRCGASTTSGWSSPPTGRPARATRASSDGARRDLEGENLEVDPPRRLVQSFTALWGEDVKSEGTSRVTWEIEPVGDSCRLTVTHDRAARGCQQRALRRLADGPLRPQDAARDRRDAHHARLAALLAGPRSTGGCLRAGRVGG